MKGLDLNRYRRVVRKARRLISHADTELACIPVELGTPVAEEFAEGALENLAEALAIIAKIKCSLRVARKEHAT